MTVTHEKRLAEPWSAEDDATLLRMWHGRSPIAEIAAHFGRTTQGVESRVRKLVYIVMTPEERAAFIAARGRGGYRWTEAELEILRANSNLPVKQIAALLPGRSAAAISHHLHKISGRNAAGSKVVARVDGADVYERPLDEPFVTRSGIPAIRCSKYGLVPYVPSLYK